MKGCKKLWFAGIVFAVLVFICGGNAAKNALAEKDKMKLLYDYTAQLEDGSGKISKVISGQAGNWKCLDDELPGEMRKEMNYNWLCEGYVHTDSLTPERQEYPRKTEEEAFETLEEGIVEDWLGTLSEPRLLTEEEKEAYRKKDSENILYSYEMESGRPNDIWYSLTGTDGRKWLIIENRESGNGQEFYCFIINFMTEEIGRCEKIHGAGGSLYQTVEDEMLIWVMTKEMDGEVVGIAGDYRGTLYIGGNFYYEKQKDGTVRENYQDYHSIGSGTIRAEGAVWDYPY